MLYIQINSEIHDPSMLYLDSDIREMEDYSVEKVPRYTPHEVPRHFVFDENGNYDAYSLIVWGKGAFCFNHTEACVQYEVATNKSIFDLTHYIDEDPGFETTSELFDDWGASRRGQDFYLYLNVYTVSKILAERYISFVENWIINNSFTYKSIPSIQVYPLRTSPIVSNGKCVSTDSIIAFEKDPNSKSIDVSWDISFPEYEGSGSEGYILLDVASIAVPLLCTCFAIGDKEQREIRTYYRHIKLIKKRILCRKEFDGIIEMPEYGHYSYDNKGNQIYRITIKNKDTGEPDFGYIATIKKKGLWKEQCSLRLDPNFKP